jgi:hypothetical protein
MSSFLSFDKSQKNSPGAAQFEVRIFLLREICIHFWETTNPGRALISGLRLRVARTSQAARDDASGFHSL